MAKRASQREQPKAAARKGTYPYYLLKAALRVGSFVRSHGGDRVGVPKSVVAADLEMDQSSSAFAQLVASAKSYGIVDGHTELRLTEAARRYYFPESVSEEREAELSFLGEPPAFRCLIDKFDGSLLPKPAMISNVLAKEFQINDSWRGRVAQIFISNAMDLGVLDQGGRLRYDAARHVAETGGGTTQPNMQIDQSPAIAVVDTQQPIVVQSPAEAIVRVSAGSSSQKTKFYSFAEGVGSLRTPYPLSYEEWEDLKNYVDVVLRPKSKEETGDNMSARNG